MKKWIRNFSLIFCCYLSIASLIAQDKFSLENQKSFLLEEIEKVESQLKEKQKAKVGKVDELKVLSNKINARQSLVNNLEKQIKDFNEEIESTETNINQLSDNISALKDEYGRMIRSAYKNKDDYSILLFLFSSANFQEAVKRMRYLRQYTDFRKRQYNLIEDNIQYLEDEKLVLEESKAEKNLLLQEEKGQTLKLKKEKEQQDKLVSQIENEEQKLQQEIEKNRKAAAKLQNEIEAIIQKEIEAARAKAAPATKATTSTVKKKRASELLNLTPEAKQLSADFEKNRGQLPWPVEKGYITDYFGEKPHAYLKHVTTENNGIDISTTSDSKVRAVFEGEVMNVAFNPSFQAAIIIRHGKYFTVYSNIKEALVETGDKVSTKQAIGIVYTDAKTAKTEVHIEIWKGDKKMNPSSWLKK